jgi:hypothetical protein
MPIDRKATLLGFSVVSFLAGLYFCLTFDKKEAFTKANANAKTNDDTSCPDLLVRKGASLLLYNTKTPDADPIPFYNLDEYINYLDIQRKKGVRCPILFLQYETTTQGTEVYRMRPSPFDLQAGIPETAASSITQLGGKPIKVLDATRDNNTYNQGQFAGFDPYGLHIGEYTDVDAIHDSTALGKSVSENPMDYNWGGVQTTENAVRVGNYVDRYVSKPMYFNPKTSYLPDVYGAGPLPPNEAPDALKPQYE